jgi:hypothetical protein
MIGAFVTGGQFSLGVQDLLLVIRRGLAMVAFAAGAMVGALLIRLVTMGAATSLSLKRSPRRYSAPTTLNSWLTKTWCGQLTPMLCTSYSPLLSFTTRSTTPPG